MGRYSTSTRERQQLMRGTTSSAPGVRVRVRMRVRVRVRVRVMVRVRIRARVRVMVGVPLSPSTPCTSRAGSSCRSGPGEIRG